MQIYKLGPSELEDFDFDSLDKSYQWFAYHYISNGVYGDGQAVGLCKNGELHLFNLDHESFYGPLEKRYRLFELDSDFVLDEDIEDPKLRTKIEELTNGENSTKGK